jgi:DNA-binding response OmpR family regulator
MPPTLKRVLIIDDEAGIRRNLSFGLTQGGFQIDDADNGLTGLEKIETSFAEGKPYDYVVTDIRLPDIDGLKLLKIIKSKHVGLPVIVISGYGSDESARQVAEHGDAFLAKPFLTEDLINQLQGIPPHNTSFETVPETSTEAANAYSFIKLKNNCNRPEFYNTWNSKEETVFCDPVLGAYDLAILHNSTNTKELAESINNSLGESEHVQNHSFCPIVPPPIDHTLTAFISEYNMNHSLSKPQIQSHSLKSYLLIEAERSQIKKLYPIVYFKDCVLSCDATKGPFSMVALTQISSGDSIERFLNEELLPLEGILRVHVLNLVQKD